MPPLVTVPKMNSKDPINTQILNRYISASPSTVCMRKRVRLDVLFVCLCVF